MTTSAVRATLEYAPADFERLPWRIRVGETACVRVSDGDYATSVLSIILRTVAEGWTATTAVHRTLTDHTAITTDQWEKVTP